MKAISSERERPKKKWTRPVPHGSASGSGSTYSIYLRKIPIKVAKRSRQFIPPGYITLDAYHPNEGDMTRKALLTMLVVPDASA